VKLAILSRAPRSYSTQRLKLAALDRGHYCKVLDTLRFAIDLSGDEPDMQFRGKPLSDYDAIIPRVGASITYFGSAVVRQFEQMDVFTPNTANGITTSRDKLRAIQILSRHDIGIPKTAFVRDRKDVLPAIDRVGGAPVVIKLLEGTQGIGVILAPDRQVAEAIIETLHNTKQNVLIQEFIAESRGRDIRALVVGDRVVAAMRRTAQGDEFRSNVHRGGTVEGVSLDATYERTAVRAAQIMGLRVAGVDMLEGNDGPLVMEVNSSPGLEGIETATGLDVAGAIIDHVGNQVAFPELDVRQRLVGEHRVRRRRDHGARGRRFRRQDHRRVGPARPRHHDPHAPPRHRRDPEPEGLTQARGERQAALLRQSGRDARHDPGPPPPARPGPQAPRASTSGTRLAPPDPVVAPTTPHGCRRRSTVRAWPPASISTTSVTPAA
jgi:ribosomal protein S6--L-glutamate ligase